MYSDYRGLLQHDITSCIGVVLSLSCYGITPEFNIILYLSVGRILMACST